MICKENSIRMGYNNFASLSNHPTALKEHGAFTSKSPEIQEEYFSLRIFFSDLYTPQNEGTMFLRNVGHRLLSEAAPHVTRMESSATPP
jgi:hypothetical protein